MPRAWIVTALATLLAMTTVGGLWIWLHWPPDWSEVYRWNNRGVGAIEQFDYPGAEKHFRQVVALAPRWTPGRINLAIALLNQPGKAGALDESVAILRNVLQTESANPHAHYCLGIILSYQGSPDAQAHFEAVTQIDPADPHAWYNLGKSLEASGIEPSDASARCFEKAAELAPALSSAIYSLAMQKIRAGETEEGQRLLKRHQQLDAAKWKETADIKYGQMGRYADVIGQPAETRSSKYGPLPLFEPVDLLVVSLAEGTRWATAADYEADEIERLRGRLRARFGLTTATFDCNGDQRSDLLVLGGVVRDGTIQDVLLRNEGGWRFTDVTEDMGLAGARRSVGCALGDVDNDGRTDLFITAVGGNRLLRHDGERFQDVTASCGIESPPALSLGAAMVDLDQDGDLDIYVTNYTTLEDAPRAFTDVPVAPLPNTFFRNDSPARVVAPDAADESGGAPLELAFRALEEPSELVAGAHSIALTTADFDNDRDVDLCLVQDGGRVELILNNRLLEFQRPEIEAEAVPAGPYNGAAVADLDKNGRMDLWLPNPNGRAALLFLNEATEFQTGATNAEKLRQARLIDVDLDGWLDIVALYQHRPLLVHNQAGRLVAVADAFALGSAMPDADAVVASDFDDDGPADLLLVGGGPPRAYRNLGNGHHWIKLQLTGMRDAGKEMRTNRDAVAARATVHAAGLWLEFEFANPAAGLGAIYEPVLVGLGRQHELDVVRLRWPDGTLQAEMGQSVNGLVRIGQEQRKPVSCPLLFAWNGRRFEFIADFLGGGGLGYLLAPGTYNVPDRDEAVKIEPGKLVPNDGYYVLRISEPMDEITYLDHLRLVAIDHPAELSVYPDERFAPPGSRPDWKLLAYRDTIFPERVLDAHGQDVTDRLRHWDRAVADGFQLRGAWIGYAEEHAIVMHFGDRLARFGPGDPLVLYLAGWVEYPFSQTNYAAATAGVQLKMPTIERLEPDGSWTPVCVDAGVPAGSPKMMTLDVTGKLTGAPCTLRIRTNMQVYWDQVFVAPLQDLSEVRVHELELVDSDLSYRGHLLEYSPDGGGPTVHDYHRVDAVPLVRQAGHMTRYGRVHELLRDDDDRFVIFGAGDDLNVEFDARDLPAVPPGWRRSFVLRTFGYCKSADVLTAHADTVEPLPFRDMSGYPFAPGERVAAPEQVEADRREFHTRVVAPR